ncbi:hypothetical protein ACEUZ9_000923 [Paracoccus litorisediminis]|uniref:hypothetical protein n=1 Tax=Paracoccus litorisediminis TaxID=2006130 RepID=UPI00373283EB
MIIIDRNNDQDYYDFAGMGRDESIVFRRDQQQSSLLLENPGLAEMTIWTDHMSRHRRYGTQRQTYLPHTGFALVGGIGIPCLRLTREEGGLMGGSVEVESIHVFDLACFEAWIADTRIVHAWDRATVKKNLATASLHFERGQIDLTDYCLAHGLITGLILRPPSTLFGMNRRKPEFSFTPMLLVTTGLQDHLPAHEAHQMVSRFVGGIMTSSPEMVELSNDTRVRKAGFDPKISFRKPKADS